MIMISNTNKEKESMYSSYAWFISIFLLSFLTSYTTAQDPYFLDSACPNTTTYSRDSTYFTNLQTLLSSLSSYNASYSTGFQNATAGQDPDRVTGLFLCRGDISPEVCRNCVTISINKALDHCQNGKEAVIYYDMCMLRYSHRNILSNVTVQKGVIMMSPYFIPSNQRERFKDLVFSTMNQAALEAANSPRKFYTRKANWTALQTLYGLVQCTPDLTSQDCLSCLNQTINKLTFDTRGSRYIWPSCGSRYELYAFYNETAFRIPSPTPLASLQPGKGGNSTVVIIAIVVPVSVSVLLFVAVFGFLITTRAKKNNDSKATDDDADDMITAGSLQFDLKDIEAATDNFSISNKLGEGGFGQVYKGTLPNEIQVAVKRLSTTSGQGEKEFMNEVAVVAKLQHRNLVKLLGFCLERGEKILVYEFVPNKSLDYFLFDSSKQSQLDWTTRYKIIGGIARGILYLHQDSRLTIIHRDLKSGNILLDAEMNPKVADFGMAKIFEVDQTEAKTRRVVGTYGYMSPEYAMYGKLSMKSDVYSFGVLVLEIISGKKNSSIYQIDRSVGNLVTDTWRLWSSGSPLELVDPSLRDNYQGNELSRCIHIALLCVQEDAEDRPTMSTIVQMLTSSIALAKPRPPGFFLRDGHEQARPSMDRFVLCSIDDGSITQVTPR